MKIKNACLQTSSSIDICKPRNGYQRGGLFADYLQVRIIFAWPRYEITLYILGKDIYPVRGIDIHLLKVYIMLYDCMHTYYYTVRPLWWNLIPYE